MSAKSRAGSARRGAGPALRLARRVALSTWLAALTGLLAAITVVLALALAISDRRTAFDQAEQITGTLASVLAEHADRLIESTDLVRAQVNDMVHAHGGVIPGDEASHARLVALVQKMPHVAAIWVGDARGEAVLTSRRFPAPGLSARDRDYFRVPRDQPGAIFIGLLPDNRFTDEVLINTSRRIEPQDGPFLGFVQVAVSPEYLRSLLQRVELGREVAWLVLDPQGRPLVREPRVPVQALASADTHAGLPIPSGRSEGTFRHVSPFDGVERLHSFRRSPRYALTVVAGVSTADLERRWRENVRIYGLSGLAVVVGLIAIGSVTSGWARRQENYARMLNREVEARTRDLQAALDEREELLCELNHRVKNAFATVQALARQTLRASPDLETFEQTFGERLSALVRTHLLLTRAEDRKSASVGDLVEAEVSPYDAGGGGRASFRGDPVTLDANRALSLSLVLHELTTNAVKYGALSTPAGRIDVDWRTEGGSLVLGWRESGGPRVEAPRRRGFGSRLLERSLAAYGGTVDASFAPDGIRVLARLPLEAAPAGGARAGELASR